MPVLTQSQFAEQMVAQLRLLKPTISGEVGTPERLILDTAAGALAESSVDLIGLQEALNVDTKFGTNLTNYLAIFGFERQQGSVATGFVKFKRTTPSNVNIVIPSGVILKSHITTATDGFLPEFKTVATATIKVGETETGLVPVIALQSGTVGNVPAGAITVMSFQNVFGISEVTNPAATEGGSGEETDNELKTRFKNTVFRNLAGTESQFLALCVATAFSTKATVIGPISKYQEYVQVPLEDDTASYPFGGGESYAGYPWPLMVRGSIESGSNVVTIPSTFGVNKEDPIEIFTAEDSPSVAFSGTVKAVLGPTTLELSGVVKVPILDGWTFVGNFLPAKEALVNKWTTALSTNPFAKEVWKDRLTFISDSASGIGKFFFREGVDFDFNFPPALQGDTLRAMIDGVGLDPRTSITGKNQPNITFINVYQASNEAVKAVSPEDVVLLEYDYTSTASRNSILHNVTNCVDVYVDGVNEQSTSTVFTAPLAGNSQAFVDDPTSKYYYENYRRDGEPTKRPLEGNILTPLYNQPVLNVPDQIVIGAGKYYKGVHYWLVHDVSGYQGTIRARDGIEWSATIGADLGGEEEGVPTEVRPTPEYTGAKFSEIHSPEHVTVDPYFYDQNVEDLQAALEANRQITTDTLAHKAHQRWFKLNITVVYNPKSTQSTVNNQIREALVTFFANQYFGSVIRLSDLLQVIHNVQGVENVRWSNDVPNDPNLIRVAQTDIEGRLLEGVFVDRFKWGNKTEPEEQFLTIVGGPEHGAYKLDYEGPQTEVIEPIEEGTDAVVLEERINAVLGPGTVTVSEDSRSSTNVTEPIRSFRIKYAAAGTRILPTVVYPLNPPDKPYSGGEYVFDSDFFLRDDELPALPTGLQPGDTVPGLIIKARAQNVWEKA